MKILDTTVGLLFPIWHGVDKKFLRDRVNLLNKGKDKLLHGEFCPDDCIHAISECCYNILNDTFKFKSEEISSIKKNHTNSQIHQKTEQAINFNSK